MRKLVIYGVSNPVIIKLIDAINRDKKIYDILGFVKSPDNEPATEVMGYPVPGEEECIPGLMEKEEVYFLDSGAEMTAGWQATVERMSTLQLGRQLVER